MIITTYIHQQPPAAGQGVRLAIFQGEGAVGSVEAMEQNLLQLELIIEQAVAYGVQLISFPELYLSGYAAPPEVLHALAQEINGILPCAGLQRSLRSNGIAIICPYPERALVGGEIRYFDSIAMFDSRWRPAEKLSQDSSMGP